MVNQICFHTHELIYLLLFIDVTQALIKFSVYPETKTTFTVQVGHANEGNPETEWFGFFSGKEGGKTVVSVR